MHTQLSQAALSSQFCSAEHPHLFANAHSSNFWHSYHIEVSIVSCYED